MLRFSILIISLLIMFRTILTEDSMRHDELHHASHDRIYTSRTGRFGFDFLENLRKNFCHSSQFCMSADSMPYFTNLICAVKCPELYLPHHSTTIPPSTTTTTAPTPSPAIPGPQMANTTTSTSSATPSTTTASITPAPTTQQAAP